MNKLFILAIIICTFTIVSAQNNADEYQLVEYDPEQHQYAYNTAINYLQIQNALTEDSFVNLLEVYEKIDNGVVYKFMISEGTYRIEVVLSEGWLGRLEVQYFKIIRYRNLRI